LKAEIAKLSVKVLKLKLIKKELKFTFKLIRKPLRKPVKELIKVITDTALVKP